MYHIKKMNEGYLIKAKRAADKEYGILEDYKVCTGGNLDYIRTKMSFGIDLSGKITSSYKYTQDGFVPIQDNHDELSRYLQKSGSYSLLKDAYYMFYVDVYYYPKYNGCLYEKIKILVPIKPMYYENNLYVLCGAMGEQINVDKMVIASYRANVLKQLKQMDLSKDRANFILLRRRCNDENKASDE